MHALRNEMNNDRADDNDLGCSVTPIIPLMDHFLYRFIDLIYQLDHFSVNVLKIHTTHNYYFFQQK